MPAAIERDFIDHVSQLFDPRHLTQLREQFEDFESLKFNKLSEREEKAVQRGEASDNFRLQEVWYQVWHEINIEHILKIFSPFTLVLYPPQVRFVRSNNHNVPWHQDIGYMRLLGERGHNQVITCFIPLESNPSNCTTIQFALDYKESNQSQEYSHQPTDSFGAGLVNTNFKKIIHYELELGDALVFGDFTPHRTFTPSNCKIERRSLEFRLVQPKHALLGKDYFDIIQQKFIKN
jgi:hypothetical protein